MVSQEPASAPIVAAGAPRVFLSYAWEDDEYRGWVKSLATRLRQDGVDARLDAWHCLNQTIPEFMNSEARNAHKVLIVCSPKYREKVHAMEDGERITGSGWEAMLVGSNLFAGLGGRERIVVCLARGEWRTAAPDFLVGLPYFDLSGADQFETRYRELLQALHDKREQAPALGTLPDDLNPLPAQPLAGPKTGDDQRQIASLPSGAEQERLAIKLLGAAPLYFEALRSEYADGFKSPSPQNAAEMVRQFSGCPSEQVQQLFFVVRRALNAVPVSSHDPGSRRAAEEAAAALYFVAACRLVDQSVRQESAASGYVLHVPWSEGILCAVIATALFGGELRLVPSDEPDLPCSEYVFEVKVPACGDQVAEDFERAVFAVVMANDADAPEVSKGSGRLEPRYSERLAARLRTIKDVHRRSLSLVVRGLTHADGCQGFGMTHRVPVMLPATEATTALLGMNAGTLLAELREFWSELQVLRRPAPQPHAEPPTHSTQGAQTMPSSSVNLHVTGGSPNISIAGNHSVAQTGTENKAYVHHAEGTDLAALSPLLQELLQAIGEVASPKARQALTAHAETAAAEVSTPDKPDPSRIKRALDAIKSGADVLDDGGKIITLCNKAYQVLAPFLGLPPSPLP